MRISILAIASVLALILAGCKPADDTPPADPRAGVESAARSPEPAPRAAAPANTPARARRPRLERNGGRRHTGGAPIRARRMHRQHERREIRSEGPPRGRRQGVWGLRPVSIEPTMNGTRCLFREIRYSLGGRTPFALTETEWPNPTTPTRRSSVRKPLERSARKSISAASRRRKKHHRPQPDAEGVFSPGGSERRSEP